MVEAMTEDKPDAALVERVKAAIAPYLADRITPPARRQAILSVLAALQPGDYLGNGNWINTVGLNDDERAAVRQAERERCAQMVDQDWSGEIAAAIRALSVEP